MMDANQVWDVPQAIKHMSELAQYKPFWIEEPTSPDDVLGRVHPSPCFHALSSLKIFFVPYCFMNL